MGNVRGAVEKLIDTVATVCSDDTTLLALGVLLNDIAILTEKCSWLDKLDGLVQALSCGLGYAHCVRVCQCLLADIVCLV